ncbi:hypothetical protein SAMN04487996_118162 [Dyadobacter soli]|uniref:C1q domain-containing protein n=1 Tax=Dyadobacter soli TaxID=659014 RepID=A0A1G7U5B5_9BACT|nr:hypothetical protein [Dyadobacter soli]SDG42653.1 hypothetical protein SAMN04487996_118162 [Dyadobacter soli]
MHLKILLISSIALALTFSAKESFGQMKIGTNSTDIEPSSNLEVEASTPGRKFKVDKTTGQLTIADGTQAISSVLVSDADGKAKWSLLTPSNLSQFPRMRADGAQTGPLVNGERINLSYPSFSVVQGGFHIPANGTYKVLYSGWYQIETRLTIENNAGCTGSSFMGLEVSLIRNGEASTYPIIDERLAPVFEDKYITKASTLVQLLAGDYTSFSILPTIKSPQAGCSVKVVEGSYLISYVP